MSPGYLSTILKSKLAAKAAVKFRTSSFAHVFGAFLILLGVVAATQQPTAAKNIFSIFSFRHAVKDTQTLKNDNVSGASVARPGSQAGKNDYVSCKILINAPVDVVWQTVHIERDSAPDLVSNRLIQGSENHSVFEQKWTVVPLLSRTSCVIDETDVPFSRINYKLLKSDEFKVMEGSWVFSPSEDGLSTVLELTAHLETLRPAPKTFINAVAKRKMAKRLAHVKTIAEKSPAQMKVHAQVL